MQRVRSLHKRVERLHSFFDHLIGSNDLDRAEKANNLAIKLTSESKGILWVIR